jgi:cell division protein FtsL
VRRKNGCAIARIALGALLFIGLFMQICMLAEISGKNKEIASVNKDISTLSAEKDNLELKIAQYAQLSRIEERALALGMQWPEDDQLRVISLPSEYGNLSAHTTEMTGSR